MRHCLTVALSGFLIAGLAGCSAGGQEQAKGARGGPVTVGFVVAKAEAVPLETTLGGRTVAYETSEVRPQVTGLIRSRNFSEGSYVSAGQPLFQIDPSLYRAAANQASANLAAAQANADAAGARAARYKPLADMEAIAKQDYTDAAAQARASRAAVAQNAAALETARINLRYTTVPAPISGRIGRSLFTVGALVNSSQADPLAVIQRTDPIYVDMQQASADLTALRRQMANGGLGEGSAAVRLTLDDGSPYGFTGSVRFSEVTVNQATGTVTLRARFPNPRGELLPGMFVKATFAQAVNPSAFLVPQGAVQRDLGGTAFLFVAGRDNKAERRIVTAERSQGANWVVTAGLKPGDRIITQGIGTLKQGAPIRPVPASAPQVPGSRPPGGAGRPAAAPAKAN